MNRLFPSSSSSLIYYRLIALWVLVEAVLGGIIHGLKIPVSGLVVGSCAVICICLIGWYQPAKGAILRATIVVAIFKMMLSPHTPPPAYIAVFFQGLIGEMLFRGRGFYRAACYILAVLALVESALQRILMLVIVYGNDLWQVVNDFINGLTKQSVPANYSGWLAGGYVVLHVLAGLFVGWWAAVMPGRLERWSREERNRVTINSPAGKTITAPPQRKKKWKKGLFVVWIVLALLYVQSVAGIGAPLLPASKVLQLLVRSVLIMLTWYFLLSPLLKKGLHRWLQQKRQRYAGDISQVLELLPATRILVRQSWDQSADRKGWQRITSCAKLVLTNALYPSPGVVILTGAVHTGKTSSLLHWSQGRVDVHGILTPIMEGKRVFSNAHTGDSFAMEAGPDETDVLAIGRYRFSKAAFEKASQIILDAAGRPGWLVIDEIGPLELEGKGFAAVIREVLQRLHPEQQLLLVVREGLVEKVKEVFGLKEVAIINDPANLRAG